MKRARHAVAIVSLLAFLLTGQAGAFGLVLCFGADGHAAVEQDHSSECGLAGGCPTPDQVGTHCDDSTEHGTPCTDVQPSLSTVSHRNDPTLAAPAAADVALFPPATLPLPSAYFAASLLRGTAATYPCRTLQVLRTTVLRC
ncbi:MAG TPA: hypothetical protein VIA07_01365 [Desulfuromonadales bacterium]|jgi:hypothetical protein